MMSIPIPMLTQMNLNLNFCLVKVNFENKNKNKIVHCSVWITFTIIDVSDSLSDTYPVISVRNESISKGKS